VIFGWESRIWFRNEFVKYRTSIGFLVSGNSWALGCEPRKSRPRWKTKGKCNAEQVRKTIVDCVSHIVPSRA